MFSAILDKLFGRKPNPERFASIFIEAARKAGYQGELVYQADEFRLYQSGGSFINLHNAYRDYLAAERASRNDVLRGYLTALLTGMKDDAVNLEQVRPLLRPVVRNRGMLEEIRLNQVQSEGWESPRAMAFRPIGEDCVEMLAVDYPESTSTLTHGPREEWGLTLDEALAIARENLRDATADTFVEIAPGVVRGNWQDCYDSSRSLLPDLLQRVSVRGRPVFMLPMRDMLLVTGDRDDTGITNMIELALEAVEQGRRVSAQVFAYADRTIIPFALPLPEHRQRQADLRRLLDQGNYATQKQFLEKIHEANGEDVFVATYMLYATEPEGNKTFSLSTWSQGVETSLPKTDRIALLADDDAAEPLVVDWEQAIPVIGDLLEPDRDLYPPRMRTRGFPSREQMAMLQPL